MKRILLVATLCLSFGLLHAQDSLIVKSIYFGGGSYYIDGQQIEELETFIDQIERIENYEIIIFSHTDNIGGKEYNEWLSQMRSTSVVKELLEINVPEELIEIRDFGFSNPLYTNRTHNGRVMNRRVDVILSPIVF
ncbi:OmpA family protein [Fulvivirga sp. RKSG066]|uniref:OmpA family protein n=1 Tax=Fulvivirga aurantia TaxID=2529383 RepID=UPI0012BCAD96|nr:OmpA family protein [Fulvivirga aurantia]MTI19735.1 OmpA family protein [Fulvivirga aurantia]